MDTQRGTTLPSFLPIVLLTHAQRESCPICRNIPFSKLDDDDESDEEDEEEEEEDDDDDLYEDGDEEEEEYREMFDRLQVGVYEGP